jgi:hypothetical protein
MHALIGICLILLFLENFVLSIFVTAELSRQIEESRNISTKQLFNVFKLILRKGNQIMSTVNTAAQTLETAISRLETAIAVERAKNAVVLALVQQLVAQTAGNGSLNQDQVVAFAKRVNEVAAQVEAEVVADDAVITAQPVVEPSPSPVDPVPVQ